MRELPSGTVTFLFTDIEGSTQLLQKLGPDRYGQVLSEQRIFLRKAIQEFGGAEIDTQGDSFFVSFPRASKAAAAVVQVQRALAAHDWPEGVDVRVRMGLHTGEPLVHEAGYVGLDIHRAARIAHTGHGGQVLLSAATAALIARDLPLGVGLRDLGEYRLKDLRTSKRIFQLEIDGLPAEFPPLKGEGRPNNLPHQMTSFVGRANELAALDQFLVDRTVRLITILGPGGMGKTRLALAAAEKQLDANRAQNGRVTPRFPHGVFMVPLAPLSAVDQIIPAIAEALGFQLETREVASFPSQENKSTIQQLLNYLKNKGLLLVLDNFEHLLDGASLAAEILEKAPRVQILATSRERLGLQGEQVFRLQGMAFPEKGAQTGDNFSAVALFENRVRLVRSDFLVDPHGRAVMGKICRLVGGMPLAIELAAAWVEVLPLADIVIEIQRGLDILQTELLEVASRHRSVRAVFESTYAKLDEREQAVFRGISVFRGGFTRQAAEKIAGATLMLLTRLVRKSLLTYNQREGRYKVHELLRQFGAEKLSADAGGKTLQDRHSEYYCQFMGDRYKDLKGARQMEAFAEIEADDENVLIAWRWAVVHGNVDRVDLALGPLDVFLSWSGRAEERVDLFSQAARILQSQVFEESRRVLLKLQIYQASAMPWKERREAMRVAQSCLDEFAKPVWQDIDVRAESALALEVLFELGEESDIYLKQAAQSMALYRDCGDLWSVAGILNSLGVDARMNTRYEESRSFHEESRALRQEIGDIRGIAMTYALQAMAEIMLGNYREAVALARESLSMNSKINNLQVSIECLYALGWSLNFLGRNHEARQAMLEEIEIVESYGLSQPASYILLGLIELDLGLYDFAESRGNFGREMARNLDHEYIEAFAMFLLGRVALIREDYKTAEKILEQALKGLGPDAAIGGDTQSNIGSLHYFLGDVLEARRRYRIALNKFLKIRFSFAAERSLSAIALIYAGGGDLEYALELQGLAETAPHVSESQWIYDLFGSRIDAAIAVLPSETVTAAKARGRKRDLWDTVEELLIDLGDQEAQI